MLKKIQEVVASELEHSGPALAVLLSAAIMLAIAGSGFLKNIF